MEGDRDPRRTLLGVVTFEQGRESYRRIRERTGTGGWGRRALQVVGPMCARVQKHERFGQHRVHIRVMAGEIGAEKGRLGMWLQLTLGLNREGS